MFVFLDDTGECFEARASDALFSKKDGASAVEKFELLEHFVVSGRGLDRVFPPRCDFVGGFAGSVFEVKCEAASLDVCG